MKQRINTTKMVRLSIIIAIIIIMAFTPLGFLMIGPVSITFMMIPVAVAAIFVGPGGGAVAGAAFGLSAFSRGFGLSPFATVLMGISPIFTFILMVFPRMLAGLLPGLAYAAISKKAGKTAGALAASLFAHVLNTVFFISTLFLLFGRTEFVQGFGDGVWAIIVVLVGTNGIVEAIFGFISGSAISRSLVHFFPDKEAAV